MRASSSALNLVSKFAEDKDSIKEIKRELTNALEKTPGGDFI